MNRTTHVFASAVKAALVSHIVLTAFENAPQTSLSLGIRMPVLKKIPQWRFFAPNPGVEDMYLMYRARDDDQQLWGEWQDISPFGERSTAMLIWNPRSRTGKAFFDVAQQLRVLAGYRSSFEWVVSSSAYALVSDFVRQSVPQRHGTFQFMILAVVPGEGDEGMKPIMVSQPQEFRPDA